MDVCNKIKGKKVCLTNPSCYALMSDMEVKASLMRDTGIDMRFVGLTCT